ncbi:hypothetical protein SAMN02910368_01369 [Lachnospiraceae bacterium G11]|nr:hypothetical protein SAMN02910368_01369 [Lachnospiraceae bacterium G11]
MGYERDAVRMISLRLNEEEATLIKNCATSHNISVSDLFRQAVLEKIEDEYNLRRYEDAVKKHKADPKKYSLDDVERELGLKR